MSLVTLTKTIVVSDLSVNWTDNKSVSFVKTVTLKDGEVVVSKTSLNYTFRQDEQHADVPVAIRNFALAIWAVPVPDLGLINDLNP